MKENTKDTLDNIYISHKETAKFDHTLQQEGTDNMKEAEDTPIIHCPAFNFFQTTISISNGKTHLKTDVLGISANLEKLHDLGSSYLEQPPI